MDEPDDREEIAIRALIAETYAAMSSGRPGTARYFAHPDIAIAGSGQGELVRGPASAARMADGVTNLGYLWTPDEISVWVRGPFAWAQILGHVTVRRDGDGRDRAVLDDGCLRARRGRMDLAVLGRVRPQAEPRV